MEGGGTRRMHVEHEAGENHKQSWGQGVQLARRYLFRAIVAAGWKGYDGIIWQRSVERKRKGKEKKDCDPAQFPRARCFNRAQRRAGNFFLTAEGVGQGEE